jgi:predicted membrane channel-forming protein YqfA (hemolysin III family)
VGSHVQPPRNSLTEVQGASHQIFHILVNVAQIVHLLGLRVSLMEH